MSVAEPIYYSERPEGDHGSLINTIDLDIGGGVKIYDAPPETKPDHPGDTRLLETDNANEYLTVHRRSGNGQYTYEYCFRVNDDTATLTTLTRMDDAKDCNLSFLPRDVIDAILRHHPQLFVEMP